MQFTVSNHGKSAVFVPDLRNVRIPVAPGETKQLDMTPYNAMFLKRCEVRGATVAIHACNDESRVVLENAMNPRSVTKKGIPQPGRVDEDELAPAVTAPVPAAEAAPPPVAAPVSDATPPRTPAAVSTKKPKVLRRR